MRAQKGSTVFGSVKAACNKVCAQNHFIFARVFSELVGEPPHHYLLRMRLQHAADLLRQGARVTEAAVKSGFPDVNHFSKSFRRRYGIPPSRYSS
jgi:AraC family transcriptional regulator